MKVRDIIKKIEEDGWVLVRTRGSHRQFKHAEKSGKVTVAAHPSLDLHPRTFLSILRQAQLEDKS